jgi:hypothetical protein
MATSDDDNERKNRGNDIRKYFQIEAVYSIQMDAEKKVLR